MWADVTARRQADGSLLAQVIAVRAAEVRLKGPLMDKPDGGIGDWTVAGRTVHVAASTAIDCVATTAMSQAPVMPSARAGLSCLTMSAVKMP